MHDHSTYGVAGPRAPRVAAGDPGVEVLARVAAVGVERHEAEPDVRDGDALGKQPGVAARSDVAPELQVDRVGVEVDALQHVLGARLHIARRDAGLEPRPAPDHRLHAVRADHDPRTEHLLPARVSYPHVPCSVRPAAHPRRFGFDQHGRAGAAGLVREERVEPRAVDRKSTRLNSSHGYISYAVFCLKKKKKKKNNNTSSITSRRRITVTTSY